jgi:hypothetical protein
MPADDAARAQARDSEGTDGPAPGRFRSAFAGTRALMRIAYRDPEHVAERLTLYAAQRLAEPSEEWAKEVRQERADTPPAAIAEELRIQSAQVARVNGAISGTPFLVALVPGYMSYLWQEARMGLRTAALYGHDPGTLQTAAEMLALRGVHPTPETAAEALAAVRDTPMPEEPKERRSLGTWTRSAYQLLVFGGFLDPSDPEEKEAEEERTRLRAAVGLAVTIGIWVSTWVFPLTFMILMAWGASPTPVNSGDGCCSSMTGRRPRPTQPSLRPTAVRTRATTNAASCVPWPSRCPCSSRSASSHTPARSASPRASTGSRRSAGSSPSPS